MDNSKVCENKNFDKLPKILQHRINMLRSTNNWNAQKDDKEINACYCAQIATEWRSRSGRVNITRADLVSIGKIVYGEDKDIITPAMFINVMSIKLRRKNIKEIMTHAPLDDMDQRTDKLMEVLYKKYLKENDAFKKDIATPLSLGEEFGVNEDLFLNPNIKHTKHRIDQPSYYNQKLKVSFDYNK